MGWRKIYAQMNDKQMLLDQSFPLNGLMNTKEEKNGKLIFSNFLYQYLFFHFNSNQMTQHEDLTNIHLIKHSSITR